MRPTRNALASGLAVVVLTVFATLVRARFLFATPYPVGIDGYYYAIQLRSLLEAGHLYYPSAPLFFWLAWPIAALAGPVAGAKLAAAASSALAVVPTYAIARRISGERAPALLAAALVATSAESFYLSAEFVKQGFGLTLALGFAAACAAGALAVAAALLAAAFLAHKTALLVALVLGLPALFERERQTPVLPNAHPLGGPARPGRARLIVVAASLLAAAAVAAGVLMPRRFLGAHDLALLGHTFTLRPAWSFAVLDIPPAAPLTFGYDVARAALVAVAVLAAAAIRRQPPPRAALGLLALALALALPFFDVHDEQGLAMRLRLLAFVAIGPLAALLLVRATPFLAAPARALIALGAAAAFVAIGPIDRGEGTIFTHPALAQAMGTLARDRSELPPDAVVVSPDRHLAFMTTWYARLPARLHPPTEPDPRRTYWLLPAPLLSAAFTRALDDLRAHPVEGVPPPRDLHPWGRNGLVLLAEPTYRFVASRAATP